MKIEHLPCLDGEVYYDINGTWATIYYKSIKSPLQFWKATWNSATLIPNEFLANPTITTSQATYEWTGANWKKVSTQCKYCGIGLVIGDRCEMCQSAIKQGMSKK